MWFYLLFLRLYIYIYLVDLGKVKQAQKNWNSLGNKTALQVFPHQGSVVGEEKKVQ